MLLTATPIQTDSTNLFQLLKLISPEDFFDRKIFEEMLEANAPLIRAQRSIWSHPPDFKIAKQNLDQALESEYFAYNPVLRQIQRSLLMRKPDSETQVKWGYKLESASLVSQYLTRSRKRDVILDRVERAPQTLTVSFDPIEKQIYETITHALRQQSKGKQGAALFQLIARQRQMASCLVAALQAWSDQGMLDDLQVWEDLGVSDPIAPTDLEPIPLTNIDYAQLELQDTKYKELIRFLRRELKKNPAEQFVLFAYFRGTLQYLQRRLAADGIHANLILGGMGDRKWELLEEFKQGKTPILLSSEVGSEGIDLQFCRFLINYDLPWNPMRVEQRIGRLDRLGQKADRISIINFSLVDTIEERILNRLYDRIQVFKESIGDLENILGEPTEQLLVSLLDPNLSDEERLKRADDTAIAILRQRHEQDRLEQEAVNLMAFSDQILNVVSCSRSQGRWLTAEELQAFVEDYFARYYLGTTIKPVLERETLFEIRLSKDAKSDLERFLRQNRFATPTRLHRSTTACIFDPRLRNAEIPKATELLDATHPLIQWIKHCYETDVKLHPISAIQCERSRVEVEPGHYVYAVDRWEFAALRAESHLAYKVARISDGKLLPDDVSERLIGQVSRYGKEKVNAANLIPDLDRVITLYSDCAKALEAGFDQATDEFYAENDHRCNIQQRSAEAYAERRRQQLQDRIDRFSQLGSRILPAIEGLLNKVNRELEDRRKTIQEHRNNVKLVSTQLAAGMIFIEN
ncbi:MAG: DNA/RNA helicase, superfamily II, SNF2 family protein [Leptolyngbya sp. ERB_1_2]